MLSTPWACEWLERVLDSDAPQSLTHECLGKEGKQGDEEQRFLSETEKDRALSEAPRAIPSISAALHSLQRGWFVFIFSFFFFFFLSRLPVGEMLEEFQAVGASGKTSECPAVVGRGGEKSGLAA